MSPLLNDRAAALILSSVLACALFGSGCAPKIGDQCHSALDCSASATRVCDQTEPHGYCTLQGCEEGSCPSEAVCVRFHPNTDRLSTTYCMYKCSDSSDCRSDQGYRCLHAMSSAKNPTMSDPQAFGEGMEAEILGNPNQAFCALRSQLPKPDAGAPSVADASAIMSGADAGL